MERITHSLSGKREDWLALRRKNIGASDMGAIFGVSPHKTALQLWAEMTGRLPVDDSDNAAMRRGRILEPAVAQGLREEYPEWLICSGDRYMEMPEVRIGATPDFLAWPTRGLHEATWAPDPSLDPFVIQAKTVAPDVYETEWTPAPPAHYLVQVQTEMLVTGINRCILAAMVLDGREFPIHEYSFQADEEFQAEILKAAAAFWRCVDENREPRLKLVQDGPTLAALYPQGEVDPVLALHGDVAFMTACAEHKAASEDVKAAEARKAAAGCRIMDRLRNHAKAEAQDFRVSWTTVPASHRSYEVKAHRRLTVNRIKGKA